MWRTPKGLRAAGRASEESDDHSARPEATAIARTRDDLQSRSLAPALTSAIVTATPTRRRAAVARWSEAE